MKLSDIVFAVECPKCGEAEGAACVSRNSGEALEGYHLERLNAGRKAQREPAPKCECGGPVESESDRCEECRARLCERCAMQGQYDARTLCHDCLPAAIQADQEAIPWP